MRSAADRLLDLAAAFLGGHAPFRVRAWDGSIAGPPDAPVLVVRSRDALRRLLWSPGELGLARAFVAGDLDVEGDLGTGLESVWDSLRQERPARAPGPRILGPRILGPRILGPRSLGPRSLGPRSLEPRSWLGVARAARGAVSLGLVGLPPRAPASEAHIGGRLHSALRDRRVIQHHYDLSNEFYALVLDETMAYSCAYWTCDAPNYGLHDAQLDKLDLISAKLGLAPGKRLLDVGCGWGSLTLHAAARYGAHVTAVTLSARQAEHVRRRVDELGLATLVEVMQRDYRAIPAGEYDAVSSIEMGEHVGKGNYPAFAARLAGHVRPGGRLLVQQMSRPRDSPGGGPFVETYIAPDMYMRPVGETVAIIESAGLEVRDVEAMREHYSRTIWAWYARLEQHHDEAVALVGDEVVRVWRLYLAGIALGFERGRTGVDQILAVRDHRSGASEMAPTREAWVTSRPGLRQQPAQRPGLRQQPAQRPGLRQQPAQRPGLRQQPAQRPGL